jgi:hypothetical protein
MFRHESTLADIGESLTYRVCGAGALARRC